MLRAPVEEIAKNENIAVKRTAVMAALPSTSEAELRRSAITAVRRAPMLPNPPSKKNAPVAGEVSHKDSNLFSAEDIKASVRLDPKASKARLRTMQINRILPVRILSYSVFTCLLLAITYVCLQFAGLAELRYQAVLKEQQLEALQHQRDELTVELAQMNSLDALEKQAKELGMVYPSNTQKIELAAENSSTKLSMNYSKK